MSSRKHKSDVITTFIKELEDQSVQAESQRARLVCGEQWERKELWKKLWSCQVFKSDILS